MAAQDVENIIRAIQGYGAYRQGQQQLALEQQRIESEAEARKAETEYRKSQTVAAQKLLEFQQQQFELQKMQAQQQLLGNYYTSGILPPGASATPIQPETQGAFPSQTLTSPLPLPGYTQAPSGAGYQKVIPGAGAAPFSPQPGTGEIPTTQQFEMPGLGTFTGPTPEAQTAFLARREEVLEGPKREAALAQMRATQEAETQRRLQEIALTQAAELQRMREERVSAEKIAANALAGENERARQQREAENFRAITQATGGLNLFTNLGPGASPSNLGAGNVTITTDANGTPTLTQQKPEDFINSQIDRIAKGQVSVDELKKQFPKQAGVFQMLAGQRGLNTLTQKQRDSVVGLEAVSGILPTIIDMNRLIQQNPIEVSVPFTEAWTKYNADMSKIQGVLPQAIRTMGQVTRFNTFEAKNYENYFAPSRTPGFGRDQANADKYNTLVTKDLQDAFNTALSGLNEGQKALIRQSLGFNNLPQLQRAIQAPGTGIGTPAGATPALPFPSPNIPAQLPQTPTSEQLPAQPSERKPSPFRYVVPQGKILVKDKKTGQIGYATRDVLDKYPNRLEEYKQ